MPDDVTYTPTTAELDTLHGQLKVLDPSKQGVTPNKLRVFYPGVGWDVIFARLHALVAAGRATHEVKGAPSFEYFTPVG